MSLASGRGQMLENPLCRWIVLALVAATACDASSIDTLDEIDQDADDIDDSFDLGKADGALEVSPGEERAIIELVNSASFEVLDDEVPLDRRAAQGIVEHREAHTFNTLEELDSIPWVGPVALERLVAYVHAQGLVSEPRQLPRCLAGLITTLPGTCHERRWGGFSYPAELTFQVTALGEDSEDRSLVLFHGIRANTSYFADEVSRQLRWLRASAPLQGSYDPSGEPRARRIIGLGATRWSIEGSNFRVQDSHYELQCSFSIEPLWSQSCTGDGCPDAGLEDDCRDSSAVTVRTQFQRDGTCEPLVRRKSCAEAYLAGTCSDEGDIASCGRGDLCPGPTDLFVCGDGGWTCCAPGRRTCPGRGCTCYDAC